MSHIKPKPGSFKDLYAGVLDVALVCCGEPLITFRYRRGGVFEIPAVFDEKFLFVDPDTEESVSTRRPMVGIKLSDLPKKPCENDQVEIHNKKFYVIDVREDGQGGAKLDLNEV